MHPDGRLEYVGYETFGGVLDYPVSAHPIRDGNDLLFHSYSVDEEVGGKCARFQRLMFQPLQTF